MRIIYHADDYAAAPEVSRHILDCKEHGKLCSLSILTNGSSFEEDMKLLKDFEKGFGDKDGLTENCGRSFGDGDGLLKSIHYNLAEGPALTAHGTSLVSDDRGMFCASFFKILIWSFTGKRRLLEKQIRAEIGAQTDRLLPFLKVKNGRRLIRVDSHQHYHMIPLVLRCILEELKARDIEIEFIRIPAEPLGPFLAKPGLWGTIKPINIVKNLVLNVLNIMDGQLLAPYRQRTAVFFGIMLSGGMDRDRVSALTPGFEKLAERRKLPLEILCHPGGVSSEEALMDPENAGCREFYLSEGRNTEKEMLCDG